MVAATEKLDAVVALVKEVFYKYRRDVPSLDCGEHFLKARALYGSAGDTVIHKKMVSTGPLALAAFWKNLFLKAIYQGHFRIRYHQ